MNDHGSEKNHPVFHIEIRQQQRRNQETYNHVVIVCH